MYLLWCILYKLVLYQIYSTSMLHRGWYKLNISFFLPFMWAMQIPNCKSIKMKYEILHVYLFYFLCEKKSTFLKHFAVRIQNKELSILFRKLFKIKFLQPSFPSRVLWNTICIWFSWNDTAADMFWYFRENYKELQNSLSYMSKSRHCD